MTRVLFFGSGLAAAMAIAGCLGTETGNPSVAPMSLDARSSDPETVSVRGAGGAIVIDEAWIAFGAIGLVPRGDCPGAAGALEGEVLGTGDHSAPGHLAFDIALGGTASFCGLVAPFTPHSGPLPPGAPSELAGRSLVIVAHLADGTRVRIVSALDREVIVSDPGGADFVLTRDAPALLISLDVARWLAGVDLGAATREPDRSIVLDDTRNTALRDAIDARIPDGVELYRDEGADGVLDPVPVLLGRGST